MRDDCPASQFGCSCGTECKSATIPLGRFAKSEKQTLNTVLAKSRAGAFAEYLVAVTIAVALITFSFVFFAVPESQRLARANQENITWNR